MNDEKNTTYRIEVWPDCYKFFKKDTDTMLAIGYPTRLTFCVDKQGKYLVTPEEKKSIREAYKLISALDAQG